MHANEIFKRILKKDLTGLSLLLATSDKTETLQVSVATGNHEKRNDRTKTTKCERRERKKINAWWWTIIWGCERPRYLDVGPCRARSEKKRGTLLRVALFQRYVLILSFTHADRPSVCFVFILHRLIFIG